MRLSAPNGKFELRNLINPGACPKCGTFVDQLWVFVPDPTDRFKVGTVINMACESCAQKKES